MGWPPSGLAFDVALHVGTLLALLVYFRRDLLVMLASLARGVRGEGFASPEARLPLVICLATVPAALAGKLGEDAIESWFRASPPLTACVLIVFGLLLAWADSRGSRTLSLERLGLPQGLVIGLAQALALVPGVSRSGITITAALFMGFSRDAAARFSFLLSLPVVAGAALLKGVELLREGFPSGEVLPFAVGIISSALVGYACVALLLRLVRRHSLAPFVWYRLAAGGAFLSWHLLT
jgi:undecaprenyl-diphosphatase